VNNLGRTRDAGYWHDQIRSDHSELMLPSIRQRAAITEAGAQSLPVHALGNRPGAREAADEFSELLRAVLAERPVAAITPAPE
jgi:chromosome partitioning protein